MKLMRILSVLLLHLTIILSLVFITFLVLDYYNPMMAFTNNGLSTILLAALCAAAILSSVMQLIICKHNIYKSRRSADLRLFFALFIIFCI